MAIKKKYLTFDELVKHWGCDKNEIHYLVSNGDLVPSFAWNDYAIESHWEPVAGDSDRLRLVSTTGEDKQEIREYLNGWVYLRRPVVLGPYKYRFTLATKAEYPKLEEFGKDAWFRLLNTDSFGHDVYGEIEHSQIESNAVFMLDMIDDCEVFNPSLLHKAADSQASSASDGCEFTQDELPTGRRDHQHEVILAVIAALEFTPLQIPDGGKAKIKSACLTRPRLFTSDSFDHAWKAGVTAGLFRLANHKKYSPN